jgi:hypothetical protein
VFNHWPIDVQPRTFFKAKGLTTASRKLLKMRADPPF